MRNILLVITTLVLLSAGCKKNKDKSPLEQLPPETQTGANTFGCLINGEIFLPKGDPLSGPIKQASYQYINGGWYFLISGSNRSSNDVKSIKIFSDSAIITIGIFDLTNYNVKGKYSGLYSQIMNATPNNYRSNDINRGQLVIKKFDTINQIVSGTFWFDAINANGQKVEVREGRFDLPYVR